MKKLYGAVQHPYYVVAPDYIRQSAGIRVMHQFCAALRRSGQEAWISTGRVNNQLDTPVLTNDVRRRNEEIGRIPIAVYPEVIGGNPLQSHVVTRYILNTPGLFGEKPRYKHSDLLFSYANALNAELESSWGVLFLPCIDSSIFNNRNNPHDSARKGWCVYPGRYTQGLVQNQTLLTDCKVITREWPSSHHDLAELFRQSEGIYCFENTAISLEARLCGCVVVHLPSPFYDSEHLMGTSEGLALGTSQSSDASHIEIARVDLPKLTATYEALEVEFWHKLEKWIEDTQALARKVADNPTPRPDIDTPLDDAAYRAWHELNAPGELHAHHLATQMVTTWKTIPSVHLLMALQPGQLGEFERTLPSLLAQLFENWMLTVVATELPPGALQAHPRIQWLEAKQPSYLNTILHEMAKASGGDWVGFLPAGIQLDPLGLQTLVNVSQENPNVQLVFGDDDVQATDGRAYHPRLKPEPDLISVCGASFLNGLALMRKDTYAASCSHAPPPQVSAYAACLHLLLTGIPETVEHVSGILARLPEGQTPSTAEAEHQEVVKQLRLARINADVFKRHAAHLRMVQPHPTLALEPITALILGSNSLEVCVAQWRHLLKMSGRNGLQHCLIANRLSSPLDSQLLRAAVTLSPDLPTTILDFQGLDDGEAIHELCLQVDTPLTWILGPTTYLIQADGLHHLAAWMRWPGVAAVQPGLWDASVGRMVCPGFTPSLLWEPLHLSPDTIDTPPTQQRSMACLNGEGMLLKTPALQNAMQQMSRVDKALWSLALSRQLTQSDHKIIWKPEIMCEIRYLNRTEAAVFRHPFLTQNLPWLVKSGGYNERLSLRKPGQVDAQRSNPWLGAHTLKHRLLLLQEEGRLFPNEHLPCLAQMSNHTGASLTLWTVSPEDSADVLLLEIVRAGPTAVYFGPHAASGPLARALKGLTEHCTSIKRICCIAPLPVAETQSDTWNLFDWLTHHQRALRLAHCALATEQVQVDALRPYHPDVKLHCLVPHT